MTWAVLAWSEAPIVIAHRGASGDLPEHTLEAYQLAIEQGADFIEPDLVVTHDGVLVARHENVLAAYREGKVVEATTDVSERPEFSDRMVTKSVNGREVTGWFVEDFTLAEIQSLYARERMGDVRPHSRAHDDRYRIPTFERVIDLVKRHEAETGRKVGIYPETKSPTYFKFAGTFAAGGKINIDTSELLVEGLVQADFVDRDRVFIQSFEIANLVDLKRRVMPKHGVDLPLVQLLGATSGGVFSQPFDVAYHLDRGDDTAAIYGALATTLPIDADTRFGTLVTPRGLRAIRAGYASGLGPNKNSVLVRTPSTSKPLRFWLTGLVASWVPDAIAVGLLVHPYTLRREMRFLSLDENGELVSLESETLRLLCAGVHGFFTDHSAAGVAARDRFLEGNSCVIADDRASSNNVERREVSHDG